MDASASSSGLAAYYVRRAATYERVYHKPWRQADLRAIEAGLAEPFAGRRVLEVACGTGWWTPHGARCAQRWLATDLAPETMAVAQTKPMPRRADGSPIVEFRTLDAHALDALHGETFDAAFAGCWWSHVRLERLAAWLDALHGHLEPGARVVMLDNRYVEGDSTPIARTDAAGNTYQLRTLDDGSTHEVLKNFPTREQALALLGPRACRARWTAHDYYWVLDYGLD